jgi:hypothetical protein
MIINRNTNKYIPYIVYIILALLILNVLLLPGYILTLDMLFTPNKQFPGNPWGLEGGWTWVSPCFPLYLVVKLANYIAPGWLIQKLILFAILFLSGIGAHRLLNSNKIGAYFAGILYMINPFTYTRFLAGQWAVLWSYALVPFAIAAFIQLLKKGRIRDGVVVAVLSTLVGLPHITGLILLFLAYLIILIFWILVTRKFVFKLSSTFKILGIASGLFLLINMYWLVPVFTERAIILSQINQADLYSFAPASHSSRVVFDVASMFGFWRNAYINIQDIFPFWWVLFLIILLLAVYGFLSKINDKSIGWLVAAFSLIGIIGLFLALGVSSIFTKDLFEWLWNNLFFFRGFRDSQKFVSLLCLAYAFLGGFGVTAFLELLKHSRNIRVRILNITLIVIIIITPIAYSFPMFGFYGQLGLADYPREWSEINEFLNHDTDDFNVLVLPWHMYMDFSWLPNKDKRLANPALQFFDKPAITGDNIEISGIYSQSTNPNSKYIEFLISNNKTINNMGELLAPLNVKYIILFHESDFSNYDFLYDQKDIEEIMDNSNISLFRNLHTSARSYSVNSVIYIQSLDDYLKLSRVQDVMEHIYVIGSGKNIDLNSPMERLLTTSKSPVNFQIQSGAPKYTVFTIPQEMSSDSWECNGQPPILRNLGFMPVFELKNTLNNIRYTRFYNIYLPSYIISGLTLIFIFIKLLFSIIKHKQSPK